MFWENSVLFGHFLATILSSTDSRLGSFAPACSLLTGGRGQAGVYNSMYRVINEAPTIFLGDPKLPKKGKPVMLGVSCEPEKEDARVELKVNLTFHSL